MHPIRRPPTPRNSLPRSVSSEFSAGGNETGAPWHASCSLSHDGTTHALGATIMENLFQDIRYGVRMLTKRPAFTAVAALSLALGIGANTTIFTIINGLLLTPIPVSNPSTSTS